MFDGIRGMAVKALVAVGVLAPASVIAVDTAVEHGFVPPAAAQRYFEWEAGSLSDDERGVFGGRWTGTVASDTPVLADGTECGGGPVEMLIARERLVGSFSHATEGYRLQVHGTLDAAGVARGGLAEGSENRATWDGTFDAYQGAGRWTDAYGCAGSLSVQREGIGRVESVSGRVFIVRGIRTIPAAPGLQLHGGDVVAVEEASSSTISLAGEALRLSERSKFEIPVPQADAPPGGVVGRLFDGGWTRLKRLVQGEPFEIKTPTAVAGVRG
ncbi:MAG: hypothetical protein AMXMBFR23_00590 [Chloroflexota bacterium]